MSPEPLPILGSDREGLLGDGERGQPLGEFAETPQGTPYAADLTCSVLSECLAILVPNKESFSAGQEAELTEVEDSCLSCKFAVPFCKVLHTSFPGAEEY